MTNMVKNAYTAYRIDNSTGSENYLSVSSPVLDSDIHGFDIWLYIESDGSEILSQNNGVCIGASREKITIKLPGKNALTVENKIIFVREKEWTNLYIGFDNNKIKVFVNGNHMGDVEYDGELLNANPLDLGKGLSGYIRSLKLYNQVVTEEQFRKYYMAASYISSMNELEYFIDFTEKRITDLTGKSVDIQIYGNCAFMDLVDVYCPQKGDFTYFAEPEDINPGGFESNEFSIYVKLYVRPSVKDKQVIYINGEWNEDDSLALLTEKKNGKKDIILRIGKTEYLIGGDVSDYSWLDVLICGSETDACIYINGEKKEVSFEKGYRRNRGGNFRIGGCQNAIDFLCENYIHTVAVFDRKLIDGDATDFLQNHPFVFEDGLVALVSFEGGEAVELVGGRQIKAGEKGLFPAQRTINELPAEGYSFRLNYTKESYSEMRKWEAEQVVSSYKDYGVFMSGCTMTASEAVLETLIRYVSNHEKLLRKSSGLYVKPVIEPSDVTSSIGKTDKGIIKSLLKSLRLSSKIGSVAGATAAQIGEASLTASAFKYEAIFALGCVVAVTTAALIITAINEIHKDKPDEDYDDKDSINLKLLSITLQHEPDSYDCSAVRCRNYKGVVTGAEWTNKEKCIAPALYIADQIKKVRIKIKYKIIDNSKRKKESYSVSLMACVSEGEKRIFDNFEFKAGGLKDGVEYDAVIESGITASVDEGICFSQVTLWWSGIVNGGLVMMPNTKLDIYIIPMIPASPIFIEKDCENYLPAIEYLKIYTQMLKKDLVEQEEQKLKNADIVGITRDQLRQLTQMIFYAPCFRYDGMGAPHYVDFRYNDGEHMLVINFHEQNLFQDINNINVHGGDPLYIECEIYAAILGYYLRLLNVDFRPVIILNPHINGNQRLCLRTNALYTAGHLDEQPQAHEFLYHMVIEVSARNEAGVNIPALIYDASMGQMQQGDVRPITGLEFSRVNGPNCDFVNEVGTYRATVFQDGMGAIIANTNQAFNIV